MEKNRIKSFRRVKRKKHVRKSLSGDAQRPRLSVFRSARHIYAQLIDDEGGVTLASASTLSEKLDGNNGNKDAATQIGTALAKKAIEVGIRQVRFDRNGYKYHGRVKALADGAREAGLVF